MTDDQRDALLDNWEDAAPGWGRQAERFSEAVAPVSEAMLARADLVPGTRVIELAAGPGDLSLAAAVAVAPTRVLCTDGVEAMLKVARERAEEEGVENIEFQRAQLEWIDLPAATADVIFCRYGLMLAVDPEAALRECRRVLAPGGRLVLAVQGAAAANPWITTPMAAATDLGLLEPASPRPSATAADGTAPVPPGPFALAGDGDLAELMRSTGFLDVEVSSVPFTYHFRNELDWVGEKLDHSPAFSAMWRQLDDARRGRVRARLRELSATSARPDGSLAVPGLALVAMGEA
jgi:SAM-dependent methyltransferase